MSDHEKNSGSTSFHEEGGAFVLEKPKTQEELARQRREDEQHEFARRQVNTNRNISWFTGALVVATFVATSVGIWQASISQKAANAAKDAVGVARDTLTETQRSNTAQEDLNRKTLNASIENFKTDERPWVSLKEVTCEDCRTSLLPEDSPRNVAQYVQAHIKSLRGEIINTGKTPAQDVMVQFRFHYGAMNLHPTDECYSHGTIICQPPPSFELRNFSVEDAPPIPDFPVLPTRIGVVPPGQPSAITFQARERSDGLSVHNRSAEPFIYVDGTITYRTPWGTTGKTTFCFYPALVDPDVPKAQSYYYCDTPGSNTMH